MAQLPGMFDASKVDTGDDNFNPLPAGEYKVQIVQSEMRATKRGDGQYLWMELDVLEGEHAGRKLWDNVNLMNPNPQAQQIGEKILAQICKATGQMSASDSEVFHFKPMIAKVKVQPATGQYDASNQVKAYRSVDVMDAVNAPQPAQAAAVEAQQTQEAAGSSLPWK